jgi:hypothetical protein
MSKRMSAWLAWAVLGLIGAYALTGCGGESGTTGPPAGTQGLMVLGTNTLVATRQHGGEEPVSILLTLSGIRAIPQAGPPVVVPVTTPTIDLLALVGQQIELGSIASLPEGTYTQIGLLVQSATVVLEGGAREAVQVPSGAQTGLKIHVQFEIASGQATVVLLDFRSKQSIHRTGQGKWILNPNAIVGIVVSGPSHSGTVPS